MRHDTKVPWSIFKKRNRVNIKKWVNVNKINTYEDLVIKCKKLGVRPPEHSHNDCIIMGFRYNPTVKKQTQKFTTGWKADNIKDMPKKVKRQATWVNKRR